MSPHPGRRSATPCAADRSCARGGRARSRLPRRSRAPGRSGARVDADQLSDRRRAERSASAASALLRERLERRASRRGSARRAGHGLFAEEHRSRRLSLASLGDLMIARQSTAVHPHAARGAHRRGGGLAQAARARRLHPPGERGGLDVPPARLARAPEGRADHPRGDGRDRRPGDAHARADAVPSSGRRRAATPSPRSSSSRTATGASSSSR